MRPVVPAFVVRTGARFLCPLHQVCARGVCLHVHHVVFCFHSSAMLSLEVAKTSHCAAELTGEPNSAQDLLLGLHLRMMSVLCAVDTP